MRVRIAIRLISTGEGGRSMPVSIDYRPDWDLGERLPDGRTVFHIARIVMIEPDPLAPGMAGTAELEPFHPELWTAMPGTAISAHEGHHPVATAVVLGLSD
jgi:hypothetical protein